MIWANGDSMRELVKDGAWVVKDGSGDILLRGSRAALESWLRRCGYTPV